MKQVYLRCECNLFSALCCRLCSVAVHVIWMVHVAVHVHYVLSVQNTGQRFCLAESAERFSW